MAQVRRTVADASADCTVVAGGGDSCDCGRLDMASVYDNFRWVLSSEQRCSLRDMGRAKMHNRLLDTNRQITDLGHQICNEFR